MSAQQTTSTEQQGSLLRLGQIGERLGFAVTGSFLASFGFDPVAREKAAMLYLEDDFPAICAALVDHIDAVRMGAPA
jgi:hypothetical protein